MIESSDTSYSVWAHQISVLALVVILGLATLSMSISIVHGQELNMTIDFSILNGQDTAVNYVGDYFTYNVTLRNNSTSLIDTDFTVEVFNVTHSLLSAQQYHRSIMSGQATQLYPNYTREGRQEYSIYFFDSAGTYELAVISGMPIAFYSYFPSGKYIVQHTVARFFFDALPASEKGLNQEIVNWVKINEAWILQSQQSLVIEQRLTQRIYTLSVLAFIVAVINAVLVVESAPRRTRLAKVILAIYLSIFIALLILTVLGLPIFGV
jgi:hypothetical protein